MAYQKLPGIYRKESQTSPIKLTENQASPIKQTKSGRGNIFTKKGRRQRAVNRFDKILQKGRKYISDNNLSEEEINENKKLNKLEKKLNKRAKSAEKKHIMIDPTTFNPGEYDYMVKGWGGDRIRPRRVKKTGEFEKYDKRMSEEREKERSPEYIEKSKILNPKKEESFWKIY